MTTAEEHLTRLRVAGQRVPRRFVRAGLLYSLHAGHHFDDRDGAVGAFYTYECVEPFDTDGIHYAPARRCSPGLMLASLGDIDSYAQARMDHSHPPTDDELDAWVRSPHRPQFIKHR